MDLEINAYKSRVKVVSEKSQDCEIILDKKEDDAECSRKSKIGLCIKSLL